MKLNTTEAGQRLGINGNRVRNLIEKGYLTDINPKVKGHKHHFYKIELKDIREFQKNFKHLLKMSKVYKTKDEELAFNGTYSTGALRGVNGKPVKTSAQGNTKTQEVRVLVETTMTSEVTDRLEHVWREMKQLNDKLDTLIEMWS